MKIPSKVFIHKSLMKKSACLTVQTQHEIETALTGLTSEFLHIRPSNQCLDFSDIYKEVVSLRESKSAVIGLLAVFGMIILALILSILMYICGKSLGCLKGFNNVLNVSVHTQNTSFFQSLKHHQDRYVSRRGGPSSWVINCF